MPVTAHSLISRRRILQTKRNHHLSAFDLVASELCCKYQPAHSKTLKGLRFANDAQSFTRSVNNTTFVYRVLRSCITTGSEGRARNNAHCTKMSLNRSLRQRKSKAILLGTTKSNSTAGADEARTVGRTVRQHQCAGVCDRIAQVCWKPRREHGRKDPRC
jgi:hypothetical protein